MNSMMSPFAIHSHAIMGSCLPIATPNSGNTFGWWRAFHLTASLQSSYVNHRQWSIRVFRRMWGRTFETNLKYSVSSKQFATLAATWRP